MTCVFAFELSLDENVRVYIGKYCIVYLCGRFERFVHVFVWFETLMQTIPNLFFGIFSNSFTLIVCNFEIFLRFQSPLGFCFGFSLLLHIFKDFGLNLMFFKFTFRFFFFFVHFY